MNAIHKQLENFLTLYDDMRATQIAYFKFHKLDDLRKAERLEKKIDAQRKALNLKLIPDDLQARWKKFIDYFDLMRKYQVLFFRNKMRADKTKAIQYEKLADGVRLELKIEQAEPVQFVQAELPL